MRPVFEKKTGFFIPQGRIDKTKTLGYNTDIVLRESTKTDPVRG